MPKIAGIKETCLSVTDVERSERFYRELFDFPLMVNEDRFCALNVADSHVLLLFAKDKSTEPVKIPGGVIPPHGPGGKSHIALAIDAADLDAWKARLAEHQVALESVVTWPLGGTSLYLRDPDEHLVELVTPGIWPIY